MTTETTQNCSCDQDETGCGSIHIHGGTTNITVNCGGCASGSNGSGTGGTGSDGSGSDGSGGDTGNGGTTGGGSDTGDQNASNPDYAIGGSGGLDFGVGIYPDPDTLPAELTPLDGYDQPGHDNYGNYQADDGSIMVFVPRFYYRIGSNDSPNWDTYGRNAIDIAGSDTFTSTEDAHAQNYVLHRAFIDGGVEVYGFFIDKFMSSQSDDGTKALSVIDKPFVYTSGYYGIGVQSTLNMQTGMNGIVSDGFRLAHQRCEGSNIGSVFMYSALSMLVMAHMQSAPAAEICAWFDTSTASYIPQSRQVGTTALNLTTHNGQNSGISDLCSGPESMMGLGRPIEPSISGPEDVLWVLRPEVKFGDMLPFEGGPNDMFGNTRQMEPMYESFTYVNQTALTGKWGNTTNPMLSGDRSGVGYHTDSLFMPFNTASISADGLEWTSSEPNRMATGNQFQCSAKLDVYAMKLEGQHNSTGYTYGFRSAVYAA